MQWERWKNWNMRWKCIIGTWHVRTLHAVGKMEELEHAMEMYHWNILSLSETRWKNQWETTTNEGHRYYCSGKDDKHEHG